MISDSIKQDINTKINSNAYEVKDYNFSEYKKHREAFFREQAGKDASFKTDLYDFLCLFLGEKVSEEQFCTLISYCESRTKYRSEVWLVFQELAEVISKFKGGRTI